MLQVGVDAALLGAKAEHDHHRHRLGAQRHGEVFQKGDRGAVGIMHVFQGEQERAALGEQKQHALKAGKSAPASWSEAGDCDASSALGRTKSTTKSISSRVMPPSARRSWPITCSTRLRSLCETPQDAASASRSASIGSARRRKCPRHPSKPSALAWLKKVRSTRDFPTPLSPSTRIICPLRELMLSWAISMHWAKIVSRPTNSIW